jgi:hypothetical protein
MAAGIAFGAVGTSTNGSSKPPAAAPAAARVTASLAKQPLAFEATGHTGRYLARGSGYSLWTTGNGTVLSLDRGRHAAPAIVRTRLAGARPTRAAAERVLPGVVNIYRGPRSEWRTGLHTYRQVRYPSVYPGIDAVYHGRKGQLEYDFEVAPGRDAGRIRMALSGAKRVSVSKEGDLQIDVTGGRLVQERPVAYQVISGKRVPVAASYRLTHGRVGFEVGSYDHSRPLVIDPVLSYSSYLGGSGQDTPQKVAINGNGVVVAGITKSNNFPGATARNNARTDEDAFLTGLNGNGIVTFTTYLGGSGDDEGADVAVSGAYAYVAGTTLSGSGFTQVSSALHPLVDSCSDGGSNAFLSKVSTIDGVVNYSTCFGGGADDSATSVAVKVGTATSAYIGGSTKSTDLPAGSSRTAFQAAKNTATGSSDAFLAQISFGIRTCVSSCTSIPYTTYFGGDTTDGISAIGVNAAVAGLVVVGNTDSNNVPVSAGGDPSSYFDGFVAKFDPSQNGILSRPYAIYFGAGTGDTGLEGVGLTSAGLAIAVGTTYASGFTNEEISGGNFSSGVAPDGVFAEINSSGAITRSIRAGSLANDALHDVAIQETGTAVAAYAVGETNGNWTSTNGIPGESCSSGNKQALVIKESGSAGVSPKGLFVTCLGGVNAAGDAATGVAVVPSGTDGTAWITGTTAAFPTVGAPQPAYGGGVSDGFLARLTQVPPTITSEPPAVTGSTSAHFGFSAESDMHFGCSDPVSGQLVAGTRSPSACTGGNGTDYSNLTEGEHVFEVVAIDDVGAESKPTSRSFRVDLTPPSVFDLTSPNDGDTTATQPSFAWATATDASAVTYQIFVDGQKVQDVPSSACSGGTCSAQAATALPGGGHKWKVVALDAAVPANSRTSSSERSFMVADPPTARFTIAPNPVLTGRSATFDASTSTPASNPIVKYEWDLDGDGSLETDGGASPVTTKSYTATGTVPIGLRITDAAGQISATTQDLRVSSTAAAGTQIGVSINKGAQYTNKPDVTLTIVAAPSATSLLVSNDGGFAAGLPSPVMKELSWKLDSSGPERLPKTVYLRFLTATFASPNYTDDIILDERPPVVNSASVVGGAGTASIARLKTYTVKVKAKDSNSGVGFVQVTANKKNPGKLIKYKTKVKAKLASRPKFLRAQDRAGNFSAWKKLR